MNPFVAVVFLLTEEGIRHFITPKLKASEEQLVLGKVNKISEAILFELAKVEAQSRSITQTIPLLDSDTIDVVVPGLVDQYGDPKVFGGGHAYLDMLGEDLLDTGVAIMARPPGKKNSTIHLLSGGEKALTAIALVFAIFQLNPAPFCLLDEVDAPLDDPNTERFCDLVRQMSAQTQFLFISHNKIAMEMAQQLIGVTMQEQGVSRIVAVDMESALSMAHA